MVGAIGCARRPRLSIVAPCYNEEQGARGIPPPHDGRGASDIVGSDYELVLFNDGSSDRTWSIMADLVRRDPHVVAINLSRRHGHQLAITAGLYTCRGERILTIDADLQDPPELLGEMWRLMERAEADVVYGLRRERQGEGRTQARHRGVVLSADAAGRLRRSAGRCRRFPADDAPRPRYSQQHAGAASFHPRHGELDRAASGADRLRSRAASRRRQAIIRSPRMIGLAFDALTSFSIMPLRLASYLGLMLGVLSILCWLTRLAAGRSGASSKAGPAC